MNPFPIIDRELRVESRRYYAYLMRSLVGLVSIAFALGILFTELQITSTPASSGKVFILWLSLFAYGVALIHGSMVSSDCLSREKREGTLGLLFLTNLSGFDIVMGKLMSQPWNTLNCLLAAIPSLSFCFLIGGIDFFQCFKIAVVIANTLFFTAAVGMFTSSISYHEIKSTLIALGISLLLGALCPIYALILSATPPLTWFPKFLFCISPGGALYSILNPSTSMFVCGISIAWWSLAISHLMGWSLLILCSVILPRTVQFKPDTAILALLKILFEPITWKPRWWRRRRRDRIAPQKWWKVNPVFQLGLQCNPYGSAPSFWFALLIAFGLVLLSAWSEIWFIPRLSGTTSPAGAFVCLFAFALHYVLRFAVTLEACYFLGNEQSKSSLELLFSTPMSDKEIISGWLLAIKRRFMPPVLMLVFFDLLIWLTSIQWTNDIGERIFYTVILLVMIAWLLFDLFCLAWIGLYMGLRSNSCNQAIRRTLFQFLGLPFFACLGIAAGIGLIREGGMEAVAGLLILFLCASSLLSLPIGSVANAMVSLQEDLRKITSMKPH